LYTHDQVFDIELSSFSFPQGSAQLTRDKVGKEKDRAPDYDRQYDFSTLFYDCFWTPEGDEVTVLGPSFLNFGNLIGEADFFIDGRCVRPKLVRHLSRCSLITFPAGGECPKVLSLKHSIFGGNLAIGGSFLSEFAGCNALYTISKDNDLEWIVDWLGYYVKAHMANAVVLFDNGSTIYSSDELCAALSSVQGIKKVAIVHARFPFGPTAEGKVNYASLYLQRSMAELCKQRFLGKARAVLNTDIDELFHSKSGQSIFDATVASTDGYLRADAQWVYANPTEKGDKIRHSDHRYVTRKNKPKANRKWCVVPNGPMKDYQWLTHFLGSKKDPVDPNFLMWHFRQVSTSWKVQRNLEPDLDLVLDPELDTVMRYHY